MRGWIAALVLLLGACSEPKPTGQLYDVGGHSLHIVCSGAERPGQPTVIIEAGLGGMAPVYHWIQHGVSAFARVCAYDRAGLGWSGDGGKPHDAAEIAGQLHALLIKAGVRPPLVLAGHSLAGLLMPVYTQAYPDEVVGLAFLDPSHPRQWSLLPGASDAVATGKRLYKLLGYAAAIGATHLYNPLLSGWADKLPEEVQAQLRYFANQRRGYVASYAEFDAFDQSAREAEMVTSLGDRPLVVLSAGYLPPPTSDEETKQFAELSAVQQLMHDEIAHLSTRGRHVTLPEATHLTLVADKACADQVVAEIRRVVEESTR